MNVSFHPPMTLNTDLKPGAYRLEHKGISTRLDAVMLENVGGNWTITADGEQSYLLAPDDQASMKVLCDEGSILFGSRISVDAEGTVHVVAP